MISNSEFYVVGGTLPGNALSYVVRAADDALFSALASGEYCYVLTSRQMGKSSLMVRTSARLRDCGVRTAVVDLTSLGQNLTAEQWYKGITNRIAQALDLEEEMDDWWYAHPDLPPLQRWLDAVRQPLSMLEGAPLVLFIDEIDMVRSLAFRTDEFFAAIRSLYNRREHDSTLRRLTVCLLGVAAPSELIEDTAITPFNIGRRIELHDFTLREAEALAPGISVTGRDGRTLIERVMTWTGGQPYLTQRMCAAIAADDAVLGAAHVDRVCAELFFAQEARYSETNLSFVRNRLLRNSGDIAAMLALYLQILHGRRIKYNPLSPACEALRLAGVVRVAEGRLRISNRIYGRVFDAAWARGSMPDAEARRQAAAYRAGAVRALALGGLAISVMAGLLFGAVQQKQRADHTGQALQAALLAARAESEKANRALYAADIYSAQKAIEEHNLTLADDLLSDCKNSSALAGYRAFEWRYLDGKLHHERACLRHRAPVLAAAFAADDLTVVTVDETAAIRTWDASTGALLSQFQPEQGATIDARSVLRAAISPDGSRVALGSAGSPIRVFDSATGRPLLTLANSAGPLCQVAYSGDANRLVGAYLHGGLRCWSAADGACLGITRLPANYTMALACDVTGSAAYAALDNGQVSEWSVAKNAQRTICEASSRLCNALACTRDARLVAFGWSDGNITLRDLRRDSMTVTLRAHTGRVTALAFTTDSRRLASAGADCSSSVWRLPEGALEQLTIGHRDQETCVSLSHAGDLIATGAQDCTVRLFAAGLPKQPPHRQIAFGTGAWASPDCMLLAHATGDAAVFVWNTHTGATVDSFSVRDCVDAVFSQDDSLLAIRNLAGNLTVRDLRAHRSLAVSTDRRAEVFCLAPDGTRLAAGTEDDRIVMLDARSGRELSAFATPLRRIAQLALAPDGSRIAAADANGSVAVLDTRTGRIFQATSATHARCDCLAFSPSGRELAAGFSGGLVCAWNLTDQSLLFQIRAHRGEIHLIAFSPDGINIATCASDHKVCIFNLLVGKEVLTLSDSSSLTAGVGFAADGQALTLVDSTGIADVWQNGVGRPAVR